MAEVEKKPRFPRLSVILGVVALVLVLGVGAYFVYKNGIFASTPDNTCTYRLTDISTSPQINSAVAYVIGDSDYNKLKQNPGSTGIDASKVLRQNGDTLTVPLNLGPWHAVVRKNAGGLGFSGSSESCNTAGSYYTIMANFETGYVTVTSNIPNTGNQGGTGGSSYIVNNQICIQGADGKYKVYNLNNRAWTSTEGDSLSYDDGLSRAGPMSNCSQPATTGGTTSGQNTDTKKCAKWTGDGNFYWITSSDKTTWYPEKSDAPTNLKTGSPLNAFEVQNDTTKCSSTTSGQGGTTQTGSTQCVKWNGTEVQLTKKDNLWMPVDSKNAPPGSERGLSDTELKNMQSSSEGKCAAAAASATTTTQRVAPINPQLPVPVIGSSSGFPVGKSSIILQAARSSYAGSPQYKGQNLTPVGGVNFTINITTTYTSQTQTGKSSFLGKVPIAYAQTTNPISDTAGGTNSKTDKAGNTNPTTDTAGGVNPIASGGGFSYKGGVIQKTKDDALDFFKRLGKAYKVSTSGTIPDNGINSQIVITNLPPGDYSIILSKNGYKNTTINFQLQDGEQKSIYPVMITPSAGAEPPSINSTATMMEANKEGAFWANGTGGKYLYVAKYPWYGWQLEGSYNTQQPYYGNDGMPYPTNPYYSPAWGQNYQAYMNGCQNTSLAVGPGIDPTKAGLAATVFGLLQPHTGKTFLEDSLLPGLGTYLAASALQDSGGSISVSQINQNCFSPQQTQYANNQGTLPTFMSLLPFQLPF